MVWQKFGLVADDRTTFALTPNLSAAFRGDDQTFTMTIVNVLDGLPGASHGPDKNKGDLDEDGRWAVIHSTRR